MTPVVMLHGWGMNGGVFRELAQALAVQRDVSAPDLPGHGDSAASEPYTLERVAAEVAERAPGRCLVVGWSLGAQVALAWARARPRQVEKLALIGATPCFVQRTDWTCAMPQPAFDAFAAGLVRDPAATLIRFVSLQARGDAAAKAVAQRLRASVAARPQLPTLRAGLNILRETDLRESVGTIAQPALVVHGECDELVPLAAAEALAESLPDGSLAVVGATAHAPFVEPRARRAVDRGVFRVTTDDVLLEKREVRRAFEHAAAGYDAAAVLQHEVCRRMFERLDYVKHAPRAILDAGTGTGNAIPALLARYPGATIVALDLARAMLAQALGRVRWWQHLPGLRPPLHAVCADLESVPLARESVGFVWSNLALQWVNDLPRAIGELHRVIAPGGLLMFSTFGPDTLRELRSAYEGTDGRTHVNRFVDMHDIGDMLVAAGFADPVMDMERITLTYAEVRALMKDLKAIGAHNATRGRPGGLSAKSVLRAVERNYEAFRTDGKLPATFEVVYGHAWKPEARVSPTGHRVIDIKASGA